MTTDITIRPANEPDMRFIRETACKVRWPRRCVNPRAPAEERHHVHDQTWEEWERSHGPTVDQWVADGQAWVAEAAGVLLAFGIVTSSPTNPDCVRMLYVKQNFRGRGIGLAILATAGLAPPYRAHLPTPSWLAWVNRIKNAHAVGTSTTG